MIKALFTAATGMRAQQTRIDVISNNLANVNTTGFKKSLASFEDLIYTTPQDATPASGAISRPTALQVGSGARLVSTTKVFTPGQLEETGQPLDLVIGGPGFFKLTDINNNTVYSRDGNFKVDADGNVVNSAGLRLAPALTVPAGADVTVGPDGQVFARVGDEAQSQIGQIELANFPNPAGLEAIGSNILRETEASGAAISANPGLDGLGRLQSGYLERSNVDVVSELVGLIIAQRAYETNSRAISAVDEMLTTVNQIVR
ncbi:MAG: flagellar basal-body rod protein FlgG [Planctomycetota bacterium]